MKNAIIIVTFLFGLDSIRAQNMNSLPTEVQEVLNTLQGHFTWEMIRPSDRKILRTGSKTSNYQLDSLVLFSQETFDSSEIEQVEFFGFNPKDSSFYSVGIYNVDLGPHLTRGSLTKESVVEFQENDSSKFFLTIIDKNNYQWTYQRLINGSWETNDLRITFSRVQN